MDLSGPTKRLTDSVTPSFTHTTRLTKAEAVHIHWTSGKTDGQTVTVLVDLNDGGYGVCPAT